MDNWKCPVCGYQASDEHQKNSHMHEMDDDAHKNLLKERAKNAALKTKDKAEDLVDDIKDKIDDTV